MRHTAAVPKAITKRYTKIFVLRVSGKADMSGVRNQLDVLRAYTHLADVREFLATFDVEMMSASSARGRTLRTTWQRDGRLEVMSRQGRKDMLGVIVTINTTRFVLYASTASQADEAEGNAFTRHICELIADPQFNGEGDPNYIRRLDAGEFDDDHQAVLYAFDPTRFVRSMGSAMEIWNAAKRVGAALEAQELFFEPAAEEHWAMMWIVVAYGSEAEVNVGKLRRFVGRLNLARDGCWPYRDTYAPLGCVATDAPDGRGRHLQVDPDQIPAVQTLVRLGLDPRNGKEDILRALAQEHGLVSKHATRDGVPVDELGPGSADRFYVQNKLEAYRDGELALTFVGPVPGRFNVGAGHILKRRWEGYGGPHGRPDRNGAITYKIPFPKPRTTGPDGEPRSGWLPGLTDDQERETWDRLLRLRGCDAHGRRLIDFITPEEWNKLSATEQKRITADRDRRDAAARGGREAQRALSHAFQPYTDDLDGTGPRHWLRIQKRKNSATTGAYCQLLRERTRSAGGINRDGTKNDTLASFHERELTAALARVILDTARRLEDEGHHIGRLDTAAEPDAAPSPGFDEKTSTDQDRAGVRANVDELTQEAQGADRLLARLLGKGLADSDPQVVNADQTSSTAWQKVREAQEELMRLEEAPVTITSERPIDLDVTNVRDVVVGLRGIYAAGAVPPHFATALTSLVPNGFRLAPGRDDLEWTLTADVALPTTEEDTLTVTSTTTVRNVAGRGAGGNATGRTTTRLARRLRDGDTVQTIAADDGSVDIAGTRRTLTSALRTAGIFAGPTQVQLALDNPIPDATRILWEALDGAPTRTSSPFADHIRRCYLQTTDTPVVAQTWSIDPHRDQRLEQVTVAAHARDLHLGLTAAGLGAALNSTRNVLDASRLRQQATRTFYPVLTRITDTDQENGWGGNGSSVLEEDHKRVRLVQCPYADCAERWATAYCPVYEVTQLGAALLCRRCRRAATPAGDTRHTDAARVVFPQAYIDWADAQIRRTGAVLRCALPGCVRDIGFGPGRTWAWDGTTTANDTWHDDACRAGTLLRDVTPCAYTACDIDEGAGPGRIQQAGRGRRRWHSRACTNAQDRHDRAARQAGTAASPR